jgi:predicted transcriptional regulator
MQKDEPMKAVRTTVSLPTEQYQQLQLLADQHGLSIAWLIRQAVNDFLSRRGSFEPMNSRPSEMED